MTMKKLRAAHPGDILLHNLMEPMKLSSNKLAKELGVTAPAVNEIARRRRAVTAEMAWRLARYFGTTAHLWQNLQAQYDLEIASQKIGKKVEHAIKPLARPDLPGRLHSHNSEPVVAFGQRTKPVDRTGAPHHPIAAIRDLGAHQKDIGT